MDISGVALITGAASGIGKACATLLARDGAAGLILVDSNSFALESVKGLILEDFKELGSSVTKKIPRIILKSINICDEAAVDAVIAEAVEVFGRLDYAINSAGVAFKHEGGAAFVETTDWTRVLNVNLNGTFFVLRAAAKAMLEQEHLRSKIDGRELQKGSIVNVASIAGLTGWAKSTAYTASKHAVLGLTKSASEDYAAQGLRINAVCPGTVNTPMIKEDPAILQSLEERTRMWTPMGRLGSAEEIADSIIFLCGGRSSFITGSALVVDGGYTER